MNRREVMKSGCFMMAGIGSIGIPSKAFGASPATSSFNPNILNAFINALQNVETGLAGNGATTAQLSALANAFSTFIAELSSTGITAQIQASMNANADEINAWQPTGADISALLADISKIVPGVTYAQAQYLANQITSQVKGDILSPSGVANILQGIETGIQQLAAFVAQNGGVLRASTSRRLGAAHLLEVFKYVEIGLIALSTGLLLAGALCPPIAVGEFLGATIFAGQIFSATGAVVGGAAAISDEEGY